MWKFLKPAAIGAGIMGAITGTVDAVKGLVNLGGAAGGPDGLGGVPSNTLENVAQTELFAKTISGVRNIFVGLFEFFKIIGQLFTGKLSFSDMMNGKLAVREGMSSHYGRELDDGTAGPGITRDPDSGIGMPSGTTMGLTTAGIVAAGTTAWGINRLRKGSSATPRPSLSATPTGGSTTGGGSTAKASGATAAADATEKVRARPSAVVSTADDAAKAAAAHPPKGKLSGGGGWKGMLFKSLATGGLVGAATLPSLADEGDAEPSNQVGSTDLTGTGLERLATSSIVIPMDTPEEFVDNRGLSQVVMDFASTLNPITNGMNTIHELKDAWNASQTWGDFGEKMTHKAHNVGYSFQESVLSLGAAPESLYNLADRFAFSGALLPGNHTRNASAEAIKDFSTNHMITDPGLRDEWDAKVRTNVDIATTVIPIGSALKSLGVVEKIATGSDKIVDGARLFAPLTP